MVTNVDLHLHSQNRRIEEKNVFRQIDPLLWVSLFYNILKTKIETLRSVLICICLGGYFERS